MHGDDGHINSGIDWIDKLDRELFTGGDSG